MQPLQEPFTLTKGESGIVQRDGLAAAALAAYYADIIEWQVPIGVGLVILPGHTFAMKLWGIDTVEMPATTLVKVQVKDASKKDTKTILGPVLYEILKTFDDRDKIARFDIPGPVKIYENQWIIIAAAGDDVATTGGVDITGCASGESYFEMAIARVRQPLSS